MTNAEGDRLLAHYEDAAALYAPAKRKAAYRRIAEALGRRIEQTSAEQTAEPTSKPTGGFVGGSRVSDYHGDF